MRLSDGTILMHGSRPYDPVKAREYYLRTRKLKGRRKGSFDDSPPARKRSSTYTVKTEDGKTRILTQKQLASQKEYAEKRVSEIKVRLDDLTKELKKRMADAREAEAKRKRGPTTADKAKAAREAKKYRDKNKQKLANKRNTGGGKKVRAEDGSLVDADYYKKGRSKTASVDDLKQKVDKVRDILKSAVARQRSLSSATKNG